MDEFRQQALIVRQVAEEVFRERQITVPYLLGTMIELPRAALTADEIAREAQFFSFGTNDLTQTTWGLSRDDAGTVPAATTSSRDIIDDDPFQVLDIAGVGKLIAMAVSWAGRPGRISSSASAASTAASRTRSPSARPADELRLLLAVPGADRAARRGASRAGGARDDGPDPGDGLIPLVIRPAAKYAYQPRAAPSVAATKVSAAAFFAFAGC